MSYSVTLSETATFTITHARHMAAKVATDLKRMQRFYERPTDAMIAAYEAEVIAFLQKGYLGTVTYGFRLDGNWVEPTLRYTARDLMNTFANDDDPGRIRPGININGATFGSYLTYSSAWDRLSWDQQMLLQELCLFNVKAQLSPESMATYKMIEFIHRAAELFIEPP